MGGKDDAKEIKDLSKQLEAFKRDMRTELRELKESVKYCADTCDEVSEFKKEFLSLRDEIKQLLKENSTLKDENEKLTQKIEELEQYQRMNNLEIKGIPKTDKTDDVMKMVEKVGEALEESIQESDIDTCHWVPTPKPDVHNIVVRFVHRRKRDELLAKARKKWLTCKDLGLESKNSVYVNEHLTQKNKKLLAAARKKKSEVNWQFVWTSKGRVLARKNETSRVIRIASQNDLEKMTSEGE